MATTPDPAKTLAIEQVVLDRIRRELQRCRKELGAAPRVLRAIQNTLNEPGLTVDEQKIVRRFRGVSRASGTDEVAAVLAQRVRAALRAGLEAAVEELALEEVLVSPAVYLVRRADKTSAKEHSTSFDGALLEARGELDRFGPADDSSERDPDDAGLLVLAEEEIFDRVRERMKAILANGGSSVAFYEKDGSESLDDFARVPAAVEVVRIDGESTEIELRMIDLLQKLEELRDDEDDDRLVGKLFHEKYRIIRRIGKGGFGSVYEATDERGAGNRVAIKVMHPEKAASAAEFKSFKEEARRVTRLDHPNIVDWKVFDETPEGVQYFVMELLEGEELDRILARETALEPMRAARLLLGVLDALRAAHRLEGGSSILHLDLKPRNLFIVPAREGRLEQVKVFDFGIGQLVGGEEEHDDGGLAVAGDLHEAFDPDKSPSTINTRSSANAARWITDEEGRRFRRCVSCTPEYASPEQSAHIMCLPEMVPLDGRSDLYSLGVAAFRMLTGEYPFPPPLERADLLRIHCEEPFRKLAEADVEVPKRLARFVDRLMEKERDARFADAGEAWRELDLFVNPPAWKRALPFAVPAAAALLALIVWLAARDTAAPRFAPRDAELGVSLASQPLYLGPERRTAVIELGPYDEGEGGLEDPGSVSCLRERDRATLAGFGATWLGEDRIELAVEEDWAGFADRLAETVLLAVDGASVDAFELRWLGPAAWSVQSARIGGREAREVAGRLAVDTHQQALEVELSGSPELERDLLEVAVEVDGGERLVRAPERSGERLACRFPLDALVPDGARRGEAVRVRVSARDRAGRVEEQSFDLAFVGAPLELTRLDLLDRWRAQESGDVALIKMGARYQIKAKNRPQLLVETANETDLHWWIQLEGSDRRVLEERAERRRTFRVDLDGLAELDEGQGYNATIHVELEDASAVLRASTDRGRIRQELPFRYFDVEPSVTASLQGSGGSTSARTLSVGLIDYWSSRDATLALARDNDAQMRVTLRVVLPDGSETAFEPNDELRLSARREVAFPLAFAREGRHALVVETFFLDTLEGVAASEADWSATYEVVVDTVPPVIAFPAGTKGELVLRLSDVLERLDAVLPGHASAVGASPIELTARIADASGREVAHSRPQSISSGTDEVALELEAPWPGTQPAGGAAQSAAPDGAYRLFFDASDLAGNRAPSLVREVVLARAPPAIEIERPIAGRPWEQRPDRWNVLIDAQDPNGLEQVECVVVRASDGLRVEVPLSSFDSGTTHAAIEGALAFSHSWSEAEVRVEVVARDRYGNESPPAIASVKLPLIKPLEPERLAAVRAGFDVEPMRLVRGNAGLAYRFGGRANDVENELFRSAGLGERYRAGNEQAWAIEYPPGAIGDFYLDEREVGVGQFLAFVRADEGWNDARWWPRAPDASGPSAERRAELLASLAALDPELPVTGVTWDEACAFARFAGKRLPSWVEWEYAVRRGGEARLFAAWESAQARPLPAAYRELNLPVVRGSAGNRSLEGLFDLDGNVSEWTSTPAWFEGSGTPPEGFREHLRRFWREALDPEASAPRLEPCPRFWCAGGSFDTRYHDFSVADRADRGTRSPSVGFRCALSLVQYHASLESGSALAGRFAPKDP